MASKVDSSGLSTISEERISARKHNDNNDDIESVYNHKNKNSCSSGHKKKLHPLMLGPSRQNQGRLVSLHSASKNNLSEFTQRIMSAKLLRVKQVQNQLNETQIQLNELINENRILRHLQKRQEGALKRYEGNHAELPQLIRAHNEEIRTLKANNKVIKAQLKESNTKLKEKENELEALRDNYNKLKKLSTEKNLLEREKLQKKVEELQDIIKEQEEKIQVLSRKILLESKNYRHHLNIEVLKHKETQKDLNSALSMINKLESQLLAKEKILPGGKALLKRDNKSFMPVIANKSGENQPKLGFSEDSFLNRDDGKRPLMRNSVESDFEFLNGIISSDDTPSPIQDIFPDINQTRKKSLEMEKTTEITSLKTDVLSGRQCATLKSRKTPLSKKPSRFSSDPEETAKAVAEKLNEEMEAIETIAQKVDETTLNLENSNSQLEEIESITFKLEEEKKSKSKVIINETPVVKENVKQQETEERRNVPKRKFEEEKQSSQISSEFDVREELSPSQLQKLDNMTKTWNDMKSKIQEERKKAEEKIRELGKVSSENDISDSISSDVDSEKIEESLLQSDLDLPPEPPKELKYVNFTDDSFILQELEKTDKVFNKLKNEQRKSDQRLNTLSSPSLGKSSKTNVTQPKPKPKQQQQQQQQQQQPTSFRTESVREPKFLEEFQTENQKRNLLKALKAIDMGRNSSSLSAEDSPESETESKKENFLAKNGLKQTKKFSSEETDKKLIKEFFGSRPSIKKNDSVNLGYGTVAGVNE